MPSVSPYDPARMPPTDYYRTVRQVLPQLRTNVQLQHDLFAFLFIPKWTVPLFAEYLEASVATAERALRRLYDLGLVAVLLGGGLRTKGAHHGGRHPNIWYLTALGERALAVLHPDRRVARAPVLGRGAPVRDRRDHWHYTRATATGRALAEHDLRCAAVALHLGALAPGSPWSIRWRLSWERRDGGAAHLIADFASMSQRKVWEPLMGNIGLSSSVFQRRVIALEVEGTEEAAHITGKHDRYDQLWRSLRRRRSVDGTDILLVVVLAFPPGKARNAARRRHIFAHANRWEASYTLAFLDLADLLAAPRGKVPWERMEAIDFYAEQANIRKAAAARERAERNARLSG